MGWFGVVRVTKIAPFDRARAYDILLAFHGNCVLHRFWDIARYWFEIADLNLPHLCLAPPLGVTPLDFRRDL